MNIIEAIKSGKPFRRKSAKRREWFIPGNSDCFYALVAEELLADDWEIKPEPREWKIWISGGELYHQWSWMTEGEKEHAKKIKVREVIE